MKLLFFDTETNNIAPGNIIELSYIVVDTGKEVRGYSGFFYVPYISEGARSCHHISVEDLWEYTGGVTFKERYKEFIDDFYEADILVGHNVSFDIKFMNAELQNLKEKQLNKPRFDTMKFFTDVCKLPSVGRRYGKYKAPKLSELVDFLGIKDNEIQNKAKAIFGASIGYHDSRYDIAATYLVVIEGIRLGYIPKKHISSIIE